MLFSQVTPPEYELITVVRKDGNSVNDATPPPSGPVISPAEPRGGWSLDLAGSFRSGQRGASGGPSVFGCFSLLRSPTKQALLLARFLSGSLSWSVLFFHLPMAAFSLQVNIAFLLFPLRVIWEQVLSSDYSRRGRFSTMSGPFLRGGRCSQGRGFFFLS